MRPQCSSLCVRLQFDWYRLHQICRGGRRHYHIKKRSNVPTAAGETERNTSKERRAAFS